MPLVRVAMRKGKPAPYRRAIADAVHAAMVEVANVPPQDRFQVMTEHAPEDLIYDASYLGIAHADDIVAPEDWSFGNGKAQYVKESP